VAMTATQLAAASGVGFQPWTAPGVTPAASSGNVLAGAAWGMPFGNEPPSGGGGAEAMPQIRCGSLPTSQLNDQHPVIGGGINLS
jgi:hypothetical protein